MKCFFYPNPPIGHVINPLMGALGWTVTQDIEKADLCFWWKFTHHEEKLPDVLRGRRCVNSGCTSTLKTEVERRFVKSFGITTFIDPLTYVGDAVVKSNLNAKHDGEVIICPIESVEEGKVYQRLLGKKDYIYNMRISVICGEVSYVSIQHKNHLFLGVIDGGVDSCEIKNPLDVFTKEWLENLKDFCDGYIDIAEIDVVDGCILDVNNTPSDARNMDDGLFDYCINRCAKLIEKYY